MHSWIPALSLADTLDDTPDDLGQLLENLDRTQLEATIVTLSDCVDLENNPDETIESQMQHLDYELLDETATHLDHALQHVHDPVLRSKSQFIDRIEVASKNLSLIVEPMLDRRDTEDALTHTQATRFALQTYTPKELIRQRAAIQAAHRALTQVLSYIDSNRALLETDPEPTGIIDSLKRALHSLLGTDTQYSGGGNAQSSESSVAADVENSLEVEPVFEPLDADESELVWGDDNDNPFAGRWVDDRHDDDAEGSDTDST